MASNTARIEASLRKTVTKLHAEKDHAKLTINGVRKEVEEALDLEDGFLRSDSTWKVKSKDIIKDQMSKVEDEDEDSGSDVKDATPPLKASKKSSKPSKPAAKPTKESKKRKASSDDEKENSAPESSDDFSDASEPPTKKKRTSGAKTSSKAKAPSKVTKVANGRRKPSRVESDEEGSDVSDQPTKPAPKKKAAARQTRPSQKDKSDAVVDADEESEDIKQDPVTKSDAGNKGPSSETVGDRGSSSLSELDDEQETKPANAQEDGDKSESEMSIVIDEAPTKRRKPSKASTADKSSKKPAKGKKNSAAKASTSDPQLDEIKTLQLQLGKCGVKKAWHLQLAPYDTSTDKIRFLKGMLADIGMTGKFSARKAEEIKERRELLAEVEAAQEFEEAHGEDKDDDEDEEQIGRSAARSKRINRAGGSAMLADLGFGDEDSDSDD